MKTQKWAFGCRMWGRDLKSSCTEHFAENARMRVCTFAQNALNYCFYKLGPWNKLYSRHEPLPGGCRRCGRVPKILGRLYPPLIHLSNKPAPY
jgi:hypothetical protein